jgi:asparagine synthase (glutamine-hydrolysing)
MPEHYLLSGDDDEKHLLKAAFRGELPPEILSRPKQPYRAPDARAFRATAGDTRGRFTDWVEEFVTDRTLRDIEPLEFGTATQLLDKLRRTPPDAVSPREDQAFVLLLSLSVLNRQMVQRSGVSMTAKRAPVARVVDLCGDAGVPSPAAAVSVHRHG